jgi:phage baseplate assembly protein W
MTTVYSFKSSGFKNRNITVESVKKISEPPIGIKTPLRISDDERSSLFNMNFRIEDQIHDNLKNLLLTNRGERLGRYEFGASLRGLTFELLNDENFEATLMKRISESVEKYMPFVELENFSSEKIKFQSDIDDLYAGLSKVTIFVEYNVPRLGITRKGLELILYVGG